MAVRGDDACHAQCDPTVPEGVARETWWYEPAKNKWKLRKRQHRRRYKKAADRQRTELLERASG